MKCFVVIGFGLKTDSKTGRQIDLDKTFVNLILPVFKKLKIECNRASEIRHSGTIDVPMYENLFNADIVVADISTLNPNALYELGVRHALRPNTTIVISESLLDYPFDLEHTVITKYEHLGKDIGVTEATRFKKELKKKVEAILSSPKVDSPVYTYLNLTPPRAKSSHQAKDDVNQKPAYARFSELLKDAEIQKDRGNYDVAKQLYTACLEFDLHNSFLIQRLTLVTYKSQKPTPKKALLNARAILDRLSPLETTDPETLGLAGAIHKRLFEIDKAPKSLDQALWFYEKSFYIRGDYYGGSNYAQLHLLRATLGGPAERRALDLGLSRRISERVLDLCNGLIKDSRLQIRSDLEWILQSKCIAEQILGVNDKKSYAAALRAASGKMSKDTFLTHYESVTNLLLQAHKGLSSDRQNLR